MLGNNYRLTILNQKTELAKGKKIKYRFISQSYKKNLKLLNKSYE